jgi:hypothetical protein
MLKGLVASLLVPLAIVLTGYTHGASSLRVVDEESGGGVVEEGHIVAAPAHASSPVDMKLTNTPNFSILPKRIYSVIGLEDSGTQFVAGIIKDALKIETYREGSNPCKRNGIKAPCREDLDVQVQHFSLPWGAFCTPNRETPIVDVVLPSQCSRDQKENQEIDQCDAMTKELWGFEMNGSRTKYPPRYNLDIISHKEWYDSHGVEQFIIIVIRDEDISASARRKHCPNPELLKQEEEVGTDIIVDAINAYILKEGERKVTRETYKFWHADSFQNNHHGRKLSALPFGNNVVLVSYESLVKLEGTYIKMLYNVLGIESDYVPDIKNGNSKYVINHRDPPHKTNHGGPH